VLVPTWPGTWQATCPSLALSLSLSLFAPCAEQTSQLTGHLFLHDACMGQVVRSGLFGFPSASDVTAPSYHKNKKPPPRKRRMCDQLAFPPPPAMPPRSRSPRIQLPDCAMCLTLAAWSQPASPPPFESQPDNPAPATSGMGQAAFKLEFEFTGWRAMPELAGFAESGRVGREKKKDKTLCLSFALFLLPLCPVATPMGSRFQSQQAQ
jgi:hypothetical protein